jgi:hypothetical protein
MIGAAIEGVVRRLMRLAHRFGSRFRLGLALLAALSSPAALYAQGCAMCYQTAAKSGNQTIQALKHGILLMLLPPLVITGAIVYLAYHKRNLFHRDARIPRADFS